MSLGVHALNIGIIVAPLGSVGRTLRSAAAGHAAYQQAGAGAYTGPLMAADGCAGNGSDYGADCGTADAGVNAGCVSIRSSDLALGVLTAFPVITTELLEVLSRAGQCHRAGSRRDGSASGKQEQG
jgi:hypothetical protein